MHKSCMRKRGKPRPQYTQSQHDRINKENPMNNIS